MLEERVIYLINAELDGALESAERAELEAVLASSEEARAMREELVKLASLLEKTPEQQPPADLVRRIIENLPAPPRRPRFSFATLFASVQPAPAAVAFAAGLLAAIGYYEVSVQDRPVADIANMVGTMVAPRQEAAAIPRDRLEISAPGLFGAVSLDVRGYIYVVNVEIQSGQPIEMQIAIAESGLDFGGLAYIGAGGAREESYEVSGGTLRVESQGRQAFSVFLQQSANGSGRDREIAVAISSAGQPVFSGSLRG